MKKLNLFIIKSFINTFIFTFLIAIFLLLMQFLWKYIDDLVGKGLEINQLFVLLFYASARFVPLALPISMLLSSIMVFGKLSENNELIALKSSGISFFKMLKPIQAFVIIISICSFLFSNYALPIANLKNASMIYDFQKKKPAFNIKEGIFYNDELLISEMPLKLLSSLRLDEQLNSQIHLNLIIEGPDVRRRYLNSSISQFDNSYLSNLIDYNRALKQRKKLLKRLFN